MTNEDTVRAELAAGARHQPRRHTTSSADWSSATRTHTTCSRHGSGDEKPTSLSTGQSTPSTGAVGWCASSRRCASSDRPEQPAGRLSLSLPPPPSPAASASAISRTTATAAAAQAAAGRARCRTSSAGTGAAIATVASYARRGISRRGDWAIACSSPTAECSRRARAAVRPGGRGVRRAPPPPAKRSVPVRCSSGGRSSGRPKWAAHSAYEEPLPQQAERSAASSAGLSGRPSSPSRRHLPGEEGHGGDAPSDPPPASAGSSRRTDEMGVHSEEEGGGELECEARSGTPGLLSLAKTGDARASSLSAAGAAASLPASALLSLRQCRQSCSAAAKAGASQ